MILRLLALNICAVALRASAQTGPTIPGLPPDEFVDVTGDRIPDLLITGRTELVSDPEQPGFHGRYRLGVRTLNGTSMLMWSTPGNQRWFTVADSQHLDTAELAARIHFKQLSWTDSSTPIEFNLLQRPFGPAITQEADGWFGTGEHYEGSMVLRSTSGGRTGIAAFSFDHPFPYGRIVVRPIEAFNVQRDFGQEGDPLPPAPQVDDPYSFGHEVEPQVIVPPGLPPDEAIDIISDEAPDVVITAREEHFQDTARIGYYVLGVSPLPGVEFLMKREGHDRWGFFRLGYEERLTPEQLSSGLANGMLRWASPGTEKVYCRVLKHPFGMDHLPQEWSHAEVDEDDVAVDGALVYRASYYGREMVIGALEVYGMVPGGALSVRGQYWVEEGKVLQMR